MSEPDVLTTAEHVRNAKHLYTTAIHAMRAYLTFWKTPTPGNEGKMRRQFNLLRKALTRFNYGVDPLAEGGDK